jgi:hypothetical protein
MTAEKIKENIKMNISLIYDYHICIEHLKGKVQGCEKEIRDLRKMLKNANK